MHSSAACTPCEMRLIASVKLWRYHASTTRLHAGLPEADALSSDEDQDALCRRASFIICVPGYNLETVVVEVQFPTVLQDVLPLVQAATCKRSGSSPSTPPACCSTTN